MCCSARLRPCSRHAFAPLQVATQAGPAWACGALLLISEVLRAQPALWSALQQPEEAGGVEEFGDMDASEGTPARGSAKGAKPQQRRQRLANGAAAAAMNGGAAGDGSSSEDERFEDAVEEGGGARGHSDDGDDAGERIHADVQLVPSGPKSKLTLQTAGDAAAAAAAARQHGSGQPSGSGRGGGGASQLLQLKLASDEAAQLQQWPREGAYDMQKR